MNNEISFLLDKTIESPLFQHSMEYEVPQAEERRGEGGKVKLKLHSGG